MSDIKDMFARLTTEQREALMLAFNECRDHIIIHEDGMFVGCNLTDTSGLIIYQQSDNGWVCGELNHE